MPRRKKYFIAVNKLAIYDKLVEELSLYVDLSEYDLKTMEVSILKRIKPYIKDIDKTISHFKRYIAINKRFIETIEGEQFITRSKLAKMLGISRPTLNDWIKKGFITPMKSKHISNTETFNTDIILQELYKLKRIL